MKIIISILLLLLQLSPVASQRLNVDPYIDNPFCLFLSWSCPQVEEDTSTGVIEYISKAYIRQEEARKIVYFNWIIRSPSRSLFTIERSEDGYTFFPVGMALGYPASIRLWYSFQDSTPITKDLVWYRVQQTNYRDTEHSTMFYSQTIYDAQAVTSVYTVSVLKPKITYYETESFRHSEPSKPTPVTITRKQKKSNVSLTVKNSTPVKLIKKPVDSTNSVLAKPTVNKTNKKVLDTNSNLIKAARLPKDSSLQNRRWMILPELLRPRYNLNK